MMKYITRITTILFFVFTVSSFSNAGNSKQFLTDADSTSFTFAFLTDIHIKQDSNAMIGFNMAIDTVNKLKPDFVITGGDLIMDALGVQQSKADSLAMLYKTVVSKFTMPVYNTKGNHDMFGVYKESGVNPDNPEYGNKFFELYFGKRYYSFNHKGWHFLILDDVKITDDRKYEGYIDDNELAWIKEDISHIDSITPIVLTAHIPFISTYGATIDAAKGASQSDLINVKQVLELFAHHNLKLVLQGHLHYFEDIKENQIHFIIGGAISGFSWKDSVNHNKEGFVMVSVKGQNIQASYLQHRRKVEFFKNAVKD
jgi:3',5'-cyclic-AMP phosphodiesterase